MFVKKRHSCELSIYLTRIVNAEVRLEKLNSSADFLFASSSRSAAASHLVLLLHFLLAAVGDFGLQRWRLYLRREFVACITFEDYHCEFNDFLTFLPQQSLFLSLLRM